MPTPDPGAITPLLVALVVSGLAAWHTRDVWDSAEYRFFVWGLSLFGALAVGVGSALLLAALLLAAALGRLSVRHLPPRPVPPRQGLSDSVLSPR